MISIRTTSNSKWVVAVIAMVLVSTAVVACSESVSAADEEQTGTVNVEETFGSFAAMFYGLAYSEPPARSTFIAETLDVSRSDSIDYISLVDGAVVNLSNSAVITIGELYIDGTVKVVNTDGSKPVVNVSSLYFSNYNTFMNDVQFIVDKSVTFVSSAEDSGFIDMNTMAFDPSKGIKGSSSVDINVDGTLTIVRGGVDTIVLGSGGNSPAFSMDVDVDLTDTYNSLKKNLDGVSTEEVITKLVDYMYNNMVYPEVSIDIDIAAVSGSFGEMKDISVSVDSSQKNKLVDVEMSIGSSEGILNCSNYKAGISFSLLKAEVSASADKLSVEFVDKNDNTNKIDIVGMDFDLSTKGDKLLQIVAQNLNTSDIQATIDAIADSDMEIEGTYKFSAAKMSGDVTAETNYGYQMTAYGAMNDTQNTKFSIVDINFNSDVDTATGSTVKGVIGDMESTVTNSLTTTTVKMSGFTEDVKTTNKNVLSILKFVKVASDSTEDGPQVDFDYRSAIVDFLDGAEVKGDISIGTYEQIINGDTYVNQVSLTGGTGVNLNADVDAKFTTVAETGAIKMTAEVDPEFTDKAVLYTKTYEGADNVYSGSESTFKNISLDISNLGFDGTVDQIGDVSKATGDFELKADVVNNTWTSGSGTTAYGESVDMTSAVYKTSVADIANTISKGGEIGPSSGAALVENSYKVSDRGTAPMTNFADLVEKADSVNTIKGSSFEYAYSEAGDMASASISDIVTVIDGTESKITDVSTTDPAAYLVKNEAGYYEVTTDASAASEGIPVYSVENKVQPASESDNTMLYIAIAIIAIIVIALIAYFLLKKRGSKA